MMKSIDNGSVMWYIILKEIFKDDTEISARFVYLATARQCCIVLHISLAVLAGLFLFWKGWFR